ncbi:MAG: hypothetical protein FWD86_00835 [Firmicutes bacterium]|nr:hypothetical protein [Bacillota bacterium]
MSNVIELVKFKLKAGVTTADFLAASDNFQKAFLQKCKGYISRKLSLNDDIWLDIVVWETMDDAQMAMTAAYESPLFADFGSLLNETDCDAGHYIVERNY